MLFIVTFTFVIIHLPQLIDVQKFETTSLLFFNQIETKTQYTVVISKVWISIYTLPLEGWSGFLLYHFSWKNWCLTTWEVVAMLPCVLSRLRTAPEPGAGQNPGRMFLFSDENAETQSSETSINRGTWRLRWESVFLYKAILCWNCHSYHILVYYSPSSNRSAYIQRASLAECKEL